MLDRGETKMKIKKLAKGYYRYGEYEILKYKVVGDGIAQRNFIQVDRNMFLFGYRETDYFTGFGHSLKECQTKIDKLQEEK